jgi:hypothetical protein
MMKRRTLSNRAMSCGPLMSVLALVLMPATCGVANELRLARRGNSANFRREKAGAGRQEATSATAKGTSISLGMAVVSADC